MNAPTLSIVIPVLNESAVLPALDRRLSSTIAHLGFACEVIFVNDGSTDQTQSILLSLANEHRNYKVINFSRNFGHQAAITAGMDHSKGEAVVIIDADLQDPPEVIPRLIEKWQEGFDVVYAVRRVRQGESSLKRWTAAAFYRLLRSLADIDLPLDAGDFRLMSRRAVEQVIQLRETHRFVRGMTTWIGFAQIGVPYDRQPRAAGQTNYPLRKMLQLALDAMLSFSTFPLQLASYVGLFGALLGLLLLLLVVYIRLFSPQSVVVGWASVIAAVTFVGSVQLVTIGVIGSYVARIYDEVRRRPLYIVSTMAGFHQDSPNRDKGSTDSHSASSDLSYRAVS